MIVSGSAVVMVSFRIAKGHLGCTGVDCWKGGAMHDLLVLTLGLLRYIGDMGKDKAYITLLFPQQGSYYDSV